VSTELRSGGAARIARRAAGPVAGLAIVAAVFLAVIPRIASYQSAWQYATNIGTRDAVIIAVSITANIVTSGPPWMAAVPGLGYRRSMLLTQTATLMTTVLPLGEAVGFATQVAMLRRWRFAAHAVTAGLVLVATWNHMLRWEWIALYSFLPVLMAWLMSQAAEADPEQRGNWRDAIILLGLGLAVDLRWLDVAWPEGMRGLGNLLLVDAGLYAFLGIRRLSGTGFDFHLHWNDWKTGLRELLFFAPAVLVLGLALALRSWIALAVFVVHAFWFDRRAREDEGRLAGLFGDIYKAYCRRVKRWIPGIY